MFDMEICCDLWYNTLTKVGENRNMLGNYERRRFSDGEKIWMGHYQNLTNVLHWHLESEIIWIVEGRAQVCIGEDRFDAQAGDVFYCAGEEMHYIISEPHARVDVAIADASVTQTLAGYALYSPYLPAKIGGAKRVERIGQLLREKGFLYRQAMEHEWQGLMLDIFRTLPCRKREEPVQQWRELLDIIHSQYAHITFEDAVRASGYSASHFSKLFKKVSGMTFSDYLNIIRVEQAITMMREHPKHTITDVATRCGFSTVRNFNRVFRNVTGYTPRCLPSDIVVDTYHHAAGSVDFDPTRQSSILLKNADLL